MPRKSYINYGVPSAILLAVPVIVPLFAVTTLSLNQSFHLPPIGAGGDRVLVDTHDDTISLSGVLPGWERYLWKEALETLAEQALGGSALSTLIGPTSFGIILWTAMTLRTDMYIQSLSFSASVSRRSALDVSMTLVHLPRPGPSALIADAVNCAVSSALDAAGVIGQ
ncbi:hypothetical protein EJC47_19730 [Sphingomonas sp. TF3]|uniref:hypothetical protein n=1 Tax=Sphingomonas sp. TF3 TaxID=2495580 RepID=UPI000F882E91|nr:hypothetical protein [Sphingomonas sp. TF3]RUN74788.1 hypothetical protein EJC47_19730 [Sphingomonas sp. TF3]